MYWNSRWIYILYWLVFGSFVLWLSPLGLFTAVATKTYPSLLLVPQFILSQKIVVVAALSCFLAFVVGLNRSPKRKDIWLLLTLPLLWGSTWFTNQREAFVVRKQGLLASTQKTRPLVDALAQYKQDNGQYPASLEQLMPKYLSALPDTGMRAYKGYNYRLPQDDDWFRGYSLHIDTPSGFINFDAFYHWPDRQKPVSDSAREYELIGDWYYFNE